MGVVNITLTAENLSTNKPLACVLHSKSNFFDVSREKNMRKAMFFGCFVRMCVRKAVFFANETEVTCGAKWWGRRGWTGLRQGWRGRGVEVEVIM